MHWLSNSQFWGLVKETLKAWDDDNVPRLGASLAYYTALSLAPLLVVILAIAGFALGKSTAQADFTNQIAATIGPRGAEAIHQIIAASAQQPTSGIVATILGLLTLFFSATSAVVELTSALNVIWHVPADPEASGFATLFTFLKQRFVSFAMILGVGFLLLVSLVMSTAVAALGSFFGPALPFSEALMHLITSAASFLVVAAVFAAIYKFLPSVHIEWRDVLVGAVVTSLLFTLGKLLLALYLGKSTMASAYGAAGSFVVVLAWVYYSAQIFYLGAEFTRIYSHRYGSKQGMEQRPGLRSKAKLVPDASLAR